MFKYVIFNSSKQQAQPHTLIYILSNRISYSDYALSTKNDNLTRITKPNIYLYKEYVAQSSQLADVDLYRNDVELLIEMCINI